ncbi:hypothetical protein DJ010_05550 [Nocardioides silvaticus]|uniref:Transglutaminase-like domain-containing protein n=1 Tax=Nocardioides silvaticus TaxID=2201891 RepID=A0A316TJ48_9ACTN|nr:DUF3488 and transglutaminase-like domain-containing protein [Nocardioides silvaticus]PWN03571.1 hypothetical protein DJ010_05550 [Nocardioides silvaticus]
MNGRPAFGYALLVSLVAAGTSWAALMAWRGFLVDSSDYLAPLLVIAVVVAASGALLRWLGSPALLTIAVQTLLAVAMVSGELGGSPLPVGEAGNQIWRSLEQAMTSARTYAAPIQSDVPPVAPLMLVGGAFFVLLVDLLACTLRRVPIAGLALLAIYSVPAGLTQSGPGLIAFVMAAAGFLALLHLDSRDLLLKWGRLLGPDEGNPWLDANPVADAVRVGAGRIGVTATVLAVFLPPFVPVLDLDVFGIGPGDGDEDIEIHNPSTDLRRDLEREEDIPLIRLRTDDPSPEYLRVAALARFTGALWSSGNRGVGDDNTATGDLPAPLGLSPDVPRREYQYEFEANDSFNSSWLPTQFPDSNVEAAGDWRFDEDTMDFLAVPKELDTRDLAWSVTGIEPEYGTTGEFFQDAAINAVDEEFLEIPSGLPPIVRRESDHVAGDARTDYEAALLLQDYFRESGGFRYSLKKAPPGVGGDAFETFLDADEEGGRIGYCEQFASAMAVMARMQGIPARVAVGFLRPESLGNGEWEYSSWDLHAWPELYFEGSGWVRFEPTPQGRAATAPDYTTVPVNAPEPTAPTSGPTVSEETRDPVEDPSQQSESAAPEQETDAAADGADEGTDWVVVLLRAGVALLVVALLVVLAYLPRLLRRRARDRRLAGTPEDLWDELAATAIDLGLAWPSGRSPQEVGRAIVDHLGDRSDVNRPERPRTGADADPEAAAALERLVAALEVARYARPGSPVPSANLADDVELCAASLEAGVTRRAARRARWLPASLWQRPARNTSKSDDLVNA